jgi:hypothetical protein
MLWTQIAVTAYVIVSEVPAGTGQDEAPAAHAGDLAGFDALGPASTYPAVGGAVGFGHQRAPRARRIAPIALLWAPGVVKPRWRSHCVNSALFCSRL